MASQKWLFLCGTAWMALVEMGWSQMPTGWRAYRMGDGFPETVCNSVTIGLNGKILVTHPNPEWVSELDGYTVRNFPRSATDVGRVCESPAGQMWAVSAEGLKEWKDNAWILHPVPEIAAAFRSGPRPPRPIPFLPIQQGRVLFLLSDRLMEFEVGETESSRTVVLHRSSQTQLGTFSSMSLAQDGGLWITGARGLAKAPGPVRSFQPDDRWHEFLPPESLGLQNWRDPWEDRDGGVTMIAESASNSQNTGVCFDGTNWTALPLTQEKIRAAWRGTDKVLRIATSDSLMQFQDGRMVETPEISARQFFDMALEPRGVLWLATSEGLLRWAPAVWQIPTTLDKLTSRVRCLSQDTAGRLWFVSAGKLHALQNDVHESFPLPESVRNTSALKLFSLRNGTLLLASDDELFQFQPADRNGRFTPVTGSDPTQRHKVIGTFKDGAVCVQSSSTDEKAQARLEKFDGTHFERFARPPADPAMREFSVLFEAQNGDFWLASERVVVVGRENKWRTFSSTDQTTPEGVSCFVELSDGKLWCGGRDKIWEFDGRSWLLVRGGFDRVNTLLRARDGGIWAASNSGLHHFWQGAWIENGVDEGLPSPSIDAVFEDAQARLWAATTRGLSRYFPEADTDPPATHIQHLTDENNKLFEGGTLNLLFNGQDRWKFTPRDRLLYSYRLDQHEWSPFQDLNAVSFPDLAAGKHYFQVRGMDRNGNLEPPTPFEFAVALPWYKEKRLLASSLLGLAAAIFFAALAFNRHRQLLRSYAEVEKKVAQRTAELEIASRELLHSQKMNALGTLAAGIAHDFNNILSIIKGSAQIIEENPDNPEKIRTRVDRIKTVVEQGSGIVKAMLGFSRDSEGQTALCDPNEVVDDTVRLLGDRFLREVDVQTAHGADLPRVAASKDFIQQILLNFIFNAAESMTGRKQIVLSTQRIAQPPTGIALAPPPAAEYVAVSVRDIGCGIPSENMPRIFEPFFTTKALSARRGTGLGLSMVYELAKKMEAGLAVESAVNEGSVFTLVVPVKDMTKEKIP
jgi:signal transduction histidine kinase/ligand-binding sensor domain-containing protein